MTVPGLTKGIIKTILLLLVTFLLSAGFTGPVHAAAKPKLSKKSLTITAGSSKKLTVKKPGRRVRWSVSGKKLVTLKASGKKKQTVTIKAGKKAGKCSVVAKIGNRKLTCRITIKKKKTPAPAPKQEDPIRFTEEENRFIYGMADTSVRLLQEINANSQGKNVLISPDSVLTCLSVMEHGAAGQTLSEMESVLAGLPKEELRKGLNDLHSRAASSEQLKYQIANSLWYKEGGIGIREQFLRDTHEYYNAEIYGAPFTAETVNQINNWVNEKTAGNIPKILEMLDEDARLVAINAIYFKGSWWEPYRTAIKRDFYPENGSARKVPMLEDTEDIYVNVHGAEGFVKPYQGGSIAFMGLLPPKGTSVDAYVKGLTGAAFIDGYRKRMSSGVIVDTRMPEFKYDFEASLTKHLARLGMQRAFTADAEFPAMSDEALCIDDILHKTHIDLNKDGTEAAAVTIGILKAASYIKPASMIKKKVYLDRPFVYALIDTKTGMPLFIGVVKTV